MGIFKDLPAPPRHALDYYKVLGYLMGMIMVRDDVGPNEAQKRAVEILEGCKP